MSDMTIELPNSPGVEVTITRGGLDPITGETLTDQWVQVSWQVDGGPDPDGKPRTHTETRGFLGP